jgi:hypothetical protein
MTLASGEKRRKKKYQKKKTSEKTSFHSIKSIFQIETYSDP